MRQRTIGIKKNGQRGTELFAFWKKISRVALKYMRLIGTKPIDFIRSETVHIVFRDYRAFSFLYPGQLYFMVTMQVRIEIGQRFLLNNDRLISRNRNGELQNFHAKKFRGIDTEGNG